MSINYATLQNTLFPAGTSTPQTLRKCSDGILINYGKVVPIAGASGYVPGCIFIHMDGSGPTVLYKNEGTAISADFKSVDSVIGNAYGTAAGKGPSPLVWEDCPYTDIMINPELGFVFFDDYLGNLDVADTKDWELTQVDTKGSIAKDITVQGGVLTVTSATGDSADDGINAQLKNCLFKPAAGVKIFFEARVAMADATQQYYVGLAGIDTTLIASGVYDDVVDKCGFIHEDATHTNDKISAICSRTSSEEVDEDVAANTDGTYIKLGFIIDGLTRVDYFVNGVNVGNCVDTSDIPNAVMALSYVAQYETADGIMSVDWVRIAQYQVAGGGRA